MVYTRPSQAWTLSGRGPLMSRRCPNCDQHLFSDEQRCWHCGLKLEPLVDSGASAPAAEPADRSFTIYGIVTAGVLLAALLLTVYLGRQPRLAPSAADLPDGWHIVTDRARNFAVFLPQAWRIFQNPGATDQLPATLTRTELYRDALLPLGGFVDDEQALILAVGSQPSTFLLVASSSILYRLSPADVAQADLRQPNAEDITVLEARQLESQGTAQTHLRVLHGADEANSALCRQRFMRGEDAALLFTLCAFPGALSDHAAETILSSIQILRE